MLTWLALLAAGMYDWGPSQSPQALLPGQNHLAGVPFPVPSLLCAGRWTYSRGAGR